MADTVTAVFQDGPCNGETKQVPIRAIQAGHTICGGEAYVLNPDLQHVGKPWVFQLASAAKNKSGASIKHVSQAWSDWMRVLAHKGPAGHNRIRKATARARRIAR